MGEEVLGIIVTKYENLEHIVGVVRAAQAARHPVRLFLSDEGVRFTRDAEFLKLLKIPGVKFFCCDYSCELIGIRDKIEGLSYGSQYNNAEMLHDSTRVLVF